MILHPVKLRVLKKCDLNNMIFSIQVNGLWLDNALDLDINKIYLCRMEYRIKRL